MDKSGALKVKCRYNAMPAVTAEQARGKRID